MTVSVPIWLNSPCITGTIIILKITWRIVESVLGSNILNWLSFIIAFIAIKR